MIPRRKPGERGFIITIELVLIMTILGIGLLAGIVAVRNALFVYAVKKKAQTVWVYDSSTPAKILGPARDFDEHEAPRLFVIDRDVDWGGATRNYRAFVGVRDDRFTSRHRIFYQNSTTCGADGVVEPCIVRSSNELGDDRAIGIVGVEVVDGGGTSFTGTGRLSQAGGIGYLYGLQPGGASGEFGPSYGIGRDVSGDGFPGDLYRECDGLGGPGEVCNCDPADIRSVWTSQTVTEGEPCEPLPGGATVEAAKCPSGRNGNNIGDPCLPPADPRCITTAGTGAGQCSNTGDPCANAFDCGLCSLDPTVDCDDDTDCADGLCSQTPPDVLCQTGSNCPGNVAGTCAMPPFTLGLSCFVDAECEGRCENTGNACANNGDCTSPASEACVDATCVGATVNLCLNSEGVCGFGTCDGGGGLVCACPPGWVDYGANCCPPGTVQTAPGQCTLGNEGDVVQAVSVDLFNDTEWTTPFRVNLPPDLDSFVLVAPGGGEGEPGIVTNIPYDPSNLPAVDFEAGDDGVEGSPP